MTQEERQQQAEIAWCLIPLVGCLHFIQHYCYIEDPQRKGETWFPFELWPEQADVVRLLFENQKVVGLKARQVGLTWLAIGVALWYMLFRPGSSIALLSARDSDAVMLLRDRMKGMYMRLPEWLRSEVVVDNDHEWRLANGSVARALPTGRGDSYTFTFALIDEADIPDNLDKTLKAIEPTIDAGGILFMISKKIKEKGETLFQKIYEGAEQGENGWKSVFLAWWVRRGRTAEWYEAKKREAMLNTGTLDGVYENYPATPEEALASLSMNKRIAKVILDKCYEPMAPLPDEELQACLASRNEGREPESEEYLRLTIGSPAIYRLPEKDRYYVIGADPAEGNPNSDNSSLHVMDRESWEEVAHLADKLEPEDFAKAIDQLGRLYNDASVMVERNNHGHAVLLWLKNNSTLHRFRSDDKKPGWLTSEKTKTLMYDQLALAFRQSDVTLHSNLTYRELESVEATTLQAPTGKKDDRATSFGLALMGAKRPLPQFV